MSDIFLSYSRKDKAKARFIAEALAAQGYSVWWDTKIPPGKTFDQVIKETLDAARCVLVLWSKESISSDWVKEEASEGLKRRILVPVLIDDVEIPLGFRRIQAAQLIDWKGALPNPEFDLLLESIGQILGKPIGTRMGNEKLSIPEKRNTKEKLPSEIAPIWKWGSMIASLSIIILLWYAGKNGSSSASSILMSWAIPAFPTIIYLMYKERLDKTTYKQRLICAGIWILIVALLWLLYALFFSYSFHFENFLFPMLLSSPAIIIDVIYIYKSR